MPRHSQPNVDTLQALDSASLKAQGCKTFKSTPPISARKEFLIRILAHAVQERRHEAISKAVAKALRELIQAKGSMGPPHAAETKLQPGARLVRRWGGTNHEVMVMDRGFAYRGSAYASLSEVARRITGAHWSGPRFFGLQRTPKKTANGEGA